MAARTTTKSTRTAAHGSEISSLRDSSRQVKSMSATSGKSSPQTSMASATATSSPASADGRSPLDSLDMRGGGGRIWTASCPCQPFSFAGRAGGVLDERHLWPAFRRLLPKRKLPTLFGEQVASAAGRAWLSGVRLDLEALGYAFGAADLPAASIGALHNRARLWWGGSHPHTAGQRQQGRAQRRPPRLFESAQFERVVEAILQHSSPGRGSSLVDGVRHRAPKLRAYGNAIVPWVGSEFIQAVMECRP